MVDGKNPKTGSSSEEEFFAREEAEKIARLRKKLDGERRSREREQLKQLHWMRCPKCGGELKEVNHHDVLVDVCSDCNGVWLDDGELELLAGAHSNPIKAIAKAISDTFKTK